MESILLVGIGGFIGAIMRYLVMLLSQNLFKEFILPLGTIIVNLSGCLLIGFFNGWVENFHIFTPQIRLFMFVGILGSFTTFSTFSYETIKMMQNGDTFQVFLNVGIQVIVGLFAAFIGFHIAYKA